MALAITGFAGPGAAEDEAGLVHFACHRCGHEPAVREERFGAIGRGPVRLASLEAAVEMLREAVEA